MIKVKVSGKEYDVQFTYTRVIHGSQKIPHDTVADIYEHGSPVLVATGNALLHPHDVGRFKYKLGRKIALANALMNTTWTKTEKEEFWGQLMPYVKI